MAKQYGLIKPKKDDNPKFVKLSAFDSDSDSDTAETTKKKPNVHIGLIQKRQIERAHNTALSEDPTIFQYDELYDDIQNERENAKVVKKNEQKGAKYIGRLIEFADKRKKEYERRIERQVQKEREMEGEMYKDKESFITSSYKQKLEEMKKADEEERRNDYLETIGDVTKQRDLGGFYRHLYEQKMGPKSVSDPKKPEIPATNTNSKSLEKEKSDKIKERMYRKRNASNQNDSDEEQTTANDSKVNAKKAHLQSNLDADSDFSIDSDSDNDNEKDDTNKHQPTDVPTKSESKSNTTTELNVSEKCEVDQVKEPNNVKKTADVDVLPEDTPENIKKEPKIDKKKIWEKRTVGDVLVAALQKYFERKQLRLQ